MQETEEDNNNTLNCKYVGQFNKLDMIGQGTYGIVFSGKSKITSQLFAIKQMRVLDENAGFPITSLREIKILKTLSKHPNIVSLKDVVVGQKKDSIFLVFQYCDIDLAKLVDQMYLDKLTFSESEIKCLSLQLIKGMAYVHQKYIIHRDLKLSNLLLSKDGILKIADFGLARQFETPLKPITRKVVTLWYRAPQLLMKYKQYGTSIDVWSVGCIIAELLNKGHPIFKGTTQFTQFQAICMLIGYPTKETWPDFFLQSRKETRKEFQKCSIYRKYELQRHFSSLSTSKSCSDLFSKIFCWDPKNRITLPQLLVHPFLTESPKPAFPDQLKILPRLDFYSKKSIQDINRRKNKG